jgi:excisionase family DNA binding protein
MHEQHEYLSVAEMAAELNVGQDKIRLWCRNGQIPCMDIGDRRRSFFRAKRSDWETFKASRTKRLPPPAPLPRFQTRATTNLLGL